MTLQISIHALLAESDLQIQDITLTSQNFYPRSPCGERRGIRPGFPDGKNFYPRSPCGERREPT